MKPFYFNHGTVLVFKSIHEEDDWFIMLKDPDDRGTRTIRLCATSAQEAAEKGYSRLEAMKEYYYE